MNKDKQETKLIKIEEKSMFRKIKIFFINLFCKTAEPRNISGIDQNINRNGENEKIKNSFMESIKNIENEETKLLELQRKYRDGKIKEEDLTKEQVNSLCTLYEKQIEELKKSNEIRKRKILENRRKKQTEN